MAIIKFKDTYDCDYLFDGTFYLDIDAGLDDIKELLNPRLYQEDYDNDNYDASYSEWVEERLNAEKIAFKEYSPHFDLVIDW